MADILKSGMRVKDALDRVERLQSIGSSVQAIQEYVTYVFSHEDASKYTDPISQKLRTLTKDDEEDSALREYLLTIPRPFGILSDFQYVLGLTRPTGADVKILKITQKAGLRTELIPVVTKFEAEDFEGTISGDLTIYPFAEFEISQLADSKEITDTYQKMQFYTLKDYQEIGKRLSHTVYQDKSCLGYTDCVPYDKTTLYLHSAIILY